MNFKSNTAFNRLSPRYLFLGVVLLLFLAGNVFADSTAPVTTTDANALWNAVPNVTFTCLDESYGCSSLNYSVDDGAFYSINYNLNHEWLNLSETDIENWVGTEYIRTISSNGSGKIYVGGFSGKFGVYDTSTNILTDLGTTDTGNWASINSILSSTFDNTGKLYTGLGGGKFGVYDPDTNIWTDLSSTDAENWYGYNTTEGLTFCGGKVYTVHQAGQFGVYDPDTNIWSNLSSTDPEDWFGSSDKIYTVTCGLDGNIYTGGDNGKLGGYNPSTNIWSNLSETDAENWQANSSVLKVFASSDGNIYTGSYNDGKLGYYSSATNIWTDLSSTDAGNWASSLALHSMTEVNSKIYIGSTFGSLSNYDPSTNIWTNLAQTDTDNWVANDAVYGMDSYSNKIYTGIQNGKFGVYETNINQTYTISILTDGNHKIEYFSTDIADNNETTKTAYHSIDTTKPVTSFSSTQITNTLDQKIILTCTDATSGCNKITYRINAGAWIDLDATTQPTQSIIQSGAGDYTINYYSTDNTGLIEETKTSTFTILPKVEMWQKILTLLPAILQLGFILLLNSIILVLLSQMLLQNETITKIGLIIGACAIIMIFLSLLL